MATIAARKKSACPELKKQYERIRKLELKIRELKSTKSSFLRSEGVFIELRKKYSAIWVRLNTANRNLHAAKRLLIAMIPKERSIIIPVRVNVATGI
jgi:hypothetical protein